MNKVGHVVNFHSAGYNALWIRKGGRKSGTFP